MVSIRKGTRDGEDTEEGPGMVSTTEGGTRGGDRGSTVSDRSRVGDDQVKSSQGKSSQVKSSHRRAPLERAASAAASLALSTVNVTGVGVSWCVPAERRCAGSVRRTSSRICHVIRGGVPWRVRRTSSRIYGRSRNEQATVRAPAHTKASSLGRRVPLPWQEGVPPWHEGVPSWQEGVPGRPSNTGPSPIRRPIRTEDGEGPRSRQSSCVRAAGGARACGLASSHSVSSSVSGRGGPSTAGFQLRKWYDGWWRAWCSA
jgi:hypothetical protein